MCLSRHALASLLVMLLLCLQASHARKSLKLSIFDIWHVGDMNDNHFFSHCVYFVCVFVQFCLQLRHVEMQSVTTLKRRNVWVRAQAQPSMLTQCKKQLIIPGVLLGCWLVKIEMRYFWIWSIRNYVIFSRYNDWNDCLFLRWLISRWSLSFKYSSW